MEDVDKGPSAEERKLKAELRKLDLESLLLEKTLRQKWWSGGKLPQYLVAVVITATAAFLWFKNFAEPVLRREGDINKLMVERNTEFNKLVEAKNDRLDYETKQLTEQKRVLEDQMSVSQRERERLQREGEELKIKAAKSASESNRLRQDGSRLRAERDQLDSRRLTLEREESGLKTAITGMRIAIERVKDKKSEFFSILNSEDPINALQSKHGWKVFSDNFFSALGYYVVIAHPKVNGGNNIFVARESDIERLKRNPEWRSYIAKVTSRAPLLSLDYSYLSLLASPEGAAGGVIYLPDVAEPVDFHAPLADWEKELNNELAGRRTKH